MALTPQQREEYIRKTYKTTVPTESGEYNAAEDVARLEMLRAERIKAKQQTAQKSAQPGFVENVVGDLRKRAGNMVQGVKSSVTNPARPLGSANLSLAGQAAGAINDVVGEGVTSAYSALPETWRTAISDKLKGAAETPAGQAALTALQKGTEAYDQLKQTNPDQVRQLEELMNLALLAPLGKAGQVATEGVEQGARKVADIAVDAADEITKKVPKYGDQVAKWLASEPDEQIKTILKETPQTKFNDYLKIAEEASVDPRKVSVFEKVGDNLAEATKQIKRQTSSLGAQKSTIIAKAKVGLQEFIEAPRRAILKVMKLDDNPLKEKVLSKLKGIKTKQDADKAIDDIQSMIYDGVDTKLIAEGSRAEKQLKSIVGELNEELKASLPKSYAKLNDQFAERIRVLNTLNRALGEVVEGVPTRGASLIKQFFSPSASKAKELFEFIKKTTGVDLAQDATVAKFMGEMFNDPRVRSLLEGVPTSKSGVVNKVVDIISEKSGLGKTIQNSFRKGGIEKARDLTR